MLQVLFALHLYVVADVPPEYGALVYEAALQEGVHPYDLGAVLISEKSGPDYDFSLLTTLADDTTWDWDTEAQGSDGEVGLFQLAPRHASKAGYKAGDLDEAEPNIRTAAVVVRYNHERHEKHGDTGCVSFIAHWKCAPSARRDTSGRCAYAQAKWQMLRVSLVSVFPPRSSWKRIKRRWKKLRKERRSTTGT
jgi:hypothetical protein